MSGDRIGEGFGSVLLAAQTGAGWAGERLWRAYSGTVSGYFAMQGLDNGEDLTSEVFIGVLRSIGSFSGDEAAFRAWLFTIAHRRVVDARRALARRPAPAGIDDEDLLPTTAGPEHDVMRQLASERVSALCRRLGPEQRDVLLLRILAGATVEEVATTLGKSPGAVKALQRRGLGALRSILEREGVTI